MIEKRCMIYGMLQDCMHNELIYMIENANAEKMYDTLAYPL